MHVNIREGFAGRYGHDYAEKRLQLALGRHRNRIGQVSVRLEKESVWTKCRVLVSLQTSDGSPQHGDRSFKPIASHRMIVVEATADDVFEAIDQAAERAAMRVSRECERSQERPSERVVARLLADEEAERQSA